MSGTFKGKVNTWLAYKVLCTIKWMVEKTLKLGLAMMRGTREELLKNNHFSLKEIAEAGWRRIRENIEEHFEDKKLGIETSSFTSFANVPASFLSGTNRDGVVYQPTGYKKIKKCLEYLQVQKNDVLIDLGAGKGRVICFMAQYDLTKVIGIELKKELASAAQKNLARLKTKRCPVTIIEGDVTSADLSEGTVYFLFNPFGSATMASVLKNIRESLVENPRKIRILYINSVHVDLFIVQDWLEKESDAGDPADTVWKNKTDDGLNRR